MKNIKQSIKTSLLGKKLKIVLITEIGIENSAEKEIKEIMNKDTVKKESVLVFNINNTKKDLLNLFKLTILSQAASKIMCVVDEFDFKDVEDLYKKIEKSINTKEFKFWTQNYDNFYVRANRLNSDLDSREIEPALGELILKKYADKKVKFDSSALRFVLHVNKTHAIFGVDIARENLSKRQYKLINSGKSLNATVAYHLIREIDYKEGEILLDPNSKTAETSIEAGLYLSGMHNFYEALASETSNILFKDIALEEELKKLKEKAKANLIKLNKNKIFAYSELLQEMNSGKSNAKVAGILDIINFSKISLDWLDTKFEKHDVDKIATFLPSESKHTASKRVSKMYKEFLYQTEYVLKETGKMGILIQKPELFIELLNHKTFKLESSSKIVIGELELNYLIITRK